MAAKSVRERRPALWPYVVMPLVVLLLFCALWRVHHPGWRLPHAAAPSAPAPVQPP